MFQTGEVKMTRCPECGSTISLGKNMKLGEFIECHECGTILELISLKPLELDYALAGEGWEEEEEGDEDWDEWEEEEEGDEDWEEWEEEEV